MKRNFMRVVVSLGFAQLALNAGAQDSTLVLNDVVVTATKINQKQSQSGKSITIISREQLDRSSGKTIAQLLGEQAGVIVNGAGSNYGKDKSLFFRGAGSAYAITLIDGILVSDPSGPGTFDLRSLPIDQVERIEILKGGQSTLYGSDAVAGVINIVTKKGGEKKFDIHGAGSAGNYDTYKGNLGLSGRNSLLSYNLNFTHLQSGGVSEAAQPDLSTAFDKDHFIQDGVNAVFQIPFSEKISFSPFFRFLYVDSEYDSDSFQDADYRYFSKHYNTGLNASYSSNRGKLTLNYSFQNTDRQYKSAYPSIFNGTLHLADVFYNYSINPNWQVLIGTDNRFTKVKQENTTTKNPETNLFSTYASVSAEKLANVFSIEIGGRYNHHNDYGDNFTYSATPSLSLLQDQLKLFGTVGKSFKAPTLNELFGPFGANRDLKPQKADNYELGFNISLAEKQFGLRVVGFERYLKDAIDYGATGYINVDRQDDWGLEVEPSFRRDKINVSGFYAFVKGRTIGVNATGGSFTKADVLLRRPKHAFGLNVGYQTTNALYLSANFRNYGKRNDFYFDSSFNRNDVILKAYSLVDFYAQYKLNSKVKVFADIKNVMNEKYEEIVGFNTLGTNVNAGLNFSLF